MAARIGPAGAPAIGNVTLAAIFNANNADQGVVPTLAHPLSTNIDDLIANWGVTLDTTGVVKSSLIIALHQTQGIPYIRTGARDAAITMTTTPQAPGAGGVAAVVGSSANEAAIQNNANGNFLRLVINAMPAARTWMIDLSTAYQVRNLTPKNIEGYFMSKGSTKVIGREILPIVEATAKALPRILADDGARAIVLNAASDWLKYHTAATSTAGLVKKVKDTLSPIFPTLFTAATIGLVDTAATNYWDKTAADAIPRTVVAIAYIWLREVKQLPDDWYQGSKAFNDFNPATARSITLMFRRYLALSSDETAIAAPADLAALAAYQAAAPGLHGY